MTTIVMLSLALVVPSPRQDQLRIEPAQASVEVDASVRLAVRPADATGISRWISSDAAVATVDSTGTVRALRPGTVRITALVGGNRATALVRVPPLPPASVELHLPADELFAGTGGPVSVVVRDRQGTVLGDAPVSFEARPAGVAAVDATGRVHGVAPGAATLVARAGAATGQARLRVLANPARDYRISVPAGRVRTGDVVRLSLSGLAADGADVGPLFPAWSLEGSGAQVAAEGGAGVFVAERPGRYMVTAVVGHEIVRRTAIDVVERGMGGELVRLGHGLTAGHHAGDTWAFEGADGRDYAIIGTYQHDWMKVFDITDPQAPVLTDSLQLDARRINDVKIHPNNRLGIVTREGASTRRNGIVLLDLSRPAHPAVLAEYTETVTGGVHNVWIDGENELVYAAHNGTRDVRIIDISDPRAPREVGQWGLENEDRSLHDVILQDGYLYLSYWDDGLIMLDAGAGTHGGTPTAPAFVSRFQYPGGHTHTAWRHGRYLFVGDEIFPSDWSADRPIEARGYIHVVDYADPDNPVEVARYEVPEGGAHNFWVEDDLLYVGYYQAGLRVVDVSGELRGDLYRQGRELAVLSTASPDAVTPNWSMTWGAQIFKGNIITSDLNSGLWIARFRPLPVVF